MDFHYPEIPKKDFIHEDKCCTSGLGTPTGSEACCRNIFAHMLVDLILTLLCFRRKLISVHSIEQLVHTIHQRRGYWNNVCIFVLCAEIC